MLSSLSTISQTFTTQRLCEAFVVCFFAGILLYLIKTFRKKGERMSNTQANVARRPDLSAIQKLPPLSESVKKINVVKQQVPIPAVQPQTPILPVETVAQTQIAPAIETHEDVVQERIRDMEVIQVETYLRIGSTEHGFVEFDLMSHREKGQEVRYLNVQVHGFSMVDRGKVNDTCMAITSKEELERVKNFFAALKWED